MGLSPTRLHSQTLSHKIEIRPKPIYWAHRENSLRLHFSLFLGGLVQFTFFLGGLVQFTSWNGPLEHLENLGSLFAACTYLGFCVW